VVKERKLKDYNKIKIEYTSNKKPVTKKNEKVKGGEAFFKHERKL
jgi:hypothetical protein